MSAATRPARRRRLVRPRWVWSGVLVTLVGCGVLGLAVVLVSVPVGLAGAVLLVGGTAVAIRAGARYDSHTSSPGQELRQVVEGDVHEGTAPGDLVVSEAAHRTARELTETTRRLHGERARAPRPPLAPAAAAVVLLVAAFLLVAQWEIYPLGRTSQNNARRALFVAVVITLAALRILVAQPSRHRVPCLLLFLGGVALVAQAGLLEHATARTAGVEAVTGLLVLAAALTCTLSPEATVGTPRRVGTPGRREGPGDGRGRLL